MPTTMTKMIKYGQLYVDPKLDIFVRNELVPGVGIDIDSLWRGFENIVKDLAPRNAALLEKRVDLQSKVDAWYREKKGTDIGLEKDKEFLKDIGYLQDEPDPFTICPENVDPEIATLAGPQLVVPVDNARYAINAANSRWGSLYDALYGTNVIAPDEGGIENKQEYNPRRGQAVIDMAMDFLDAHFALMNGSHKQVESYAVVEEKLVPPLSDSSKFVGYQGDADFPDVILLRNNGLHVEINIDRKHLIGSQHPAGVSDIILESAISTIMDCEDSVAAVDAEDKVNVYRNWFGIMKGDLCVEVNKGGRNVCRRLNPDRVYQKPDGEFLTLPGRSLLMARNVGMHVLTDAVQLNGEIPIPETFLDGLMTTLAGLYDLQGKSSVKNSRTGSIYIVKPKMHGPDEVALQVEFFSQIEKLLKIEKNTLKMGIMDEERRTTINLAACIQAARERIVFINTGFLDRTGDEIHTAMHAGSVLPKNDIKKAIWLSAYEDSNVDTGLKCGMHGKAQIGKGMWAMPDQMAEMVVNKIDHLHAGANTAWVPSPTAATLHALHYHMIDVSAIQQKLLNRTAASVDDILTPPLLGKRTLSEKEISEELENNAQGILGYMVRWIDQGIGCSKVPDIHNVHLMEDRATLRISSQHLANWLLHGVINKEQVIKTFEKMAVVVDRQNQNDPSYKKMATNFSTNIAFQAALELVFKGVVTPSGYTEAILSSHRREFKVSVLNT